MKADIAKIIITCENNLVVSCFFKHPILDVWQGSEYASGSHYLRVLNSPGFWICLWFWMRQNFRYTRVLNLPGFWICQSYTGFRICLNNSWICLNMPNYVWIWLNTPEYAWMYLNLPEWLLFYISPFPHMFTIPHQFEHVVTYLSLYRRLEVVVLRNIRLFSWRYKICFL